MLLRIIMGSWLAGLMMANAAQGEGNKGGQAAESGYNFGFFNRIEMVKTLFSGLKKVYRVAECCHWPRWGPVTGSGSGFSPS